MRHAGRVKMAAGADYGFTTTRTTPGAGKRFGRAHAGAMALCLALCFALGAAFSGAAWAEGALSDPGLGFEPDIPCKKSEVPYFDRLDSTQVRLAWDASFDAHIALLGKYPDFENPTDFICWRLPAGLFGTWDWRALCWRVDEYLYSLPPLERAVAWHGLCNILEPLARGYESAVGQTRALVEGVARQRLQNPLPAGSPDFSCADLQNIADRYQGLELAYAAIAQKLRGEQVKNLALLPQDIRQALGQSHLIGSGPTSRVDIPSPEAAFLARIHQERLAIVKDLDEVMYEVGVAFDSVSMVASRVNFNQDDKDYLFLAETCTHAAVAQLAADRRLPDNLGRTIDKAIKGVIPEHLGNILIHFESAVESGEAPSFKIRRDKGYLSYYWREVEIERRARDLVRELKEYAER